MRHREPHPPLVPDLPPGVAASICDSVTARSRKRLRPAETYDEKVERLARDVENVVARQESVDTDDLTTLGWSIPILAELLPDALERVRGRALRHLI